MHLVSPPDARFLELTIAIPCNRQYRTRAVAPALVIDHGEIAFDVNPILRTAANGAGAAKDRFVPHTGQSGQKCLAFEPKALGGLH